MRRVLPRGRRVVPLVLPAVVPLLLVLSLLPLWSCGAGMAWAAEAGNVGDLFRAVEQGEVRLPRGANSSANPSVSPQITPQTLLNQMLGGDTAPQSLPGVEITPEQMQEVFPQPLPHTAPTMSMPNMPPMWQDNRPQGGQGFGWTGGSTGGAGGMGAAGGAATLPLAPVQGSTHFGSMGGQGGGLPLTPSQGTPRAQGNGFSSRQSPMPQHPTRQQYRATPPRQQTTPQNAMPQSVSPQPQTWRQEHIVLQDGEDVTPSSAASAQTPQPAQSVVPQGTLQPDAPRPNAVGQADAPASAVRQEAPVLQPSRQAPQQSLRAPTAAQGVGQAAGARGTGRTQRTAWPPARPSVACMAGQMLMVGFAGHEPQQVQAIVEAVRQGLVGGVILQVRDAAGVRNVLSPPQVRTLTALLQQAAREGGGIPLFIAVEQEGGLVQALPPSLGFEGGSAAQRLGMGTTEQSHVAGRRMGLELAALGVNMNLAPVADVNHNPLSPHMGKKFRSFGGNAAQVAAHAVAFGQGLAAVGVVPCLKYFPGTGSLFSLFSGQDNALPDMSGTWRQDELLPYAEAIKQGWRGAVMPALAYHRGFDSLHPVTLSPVLLQDVLRRRMGFNGLVISNDLQGLGAEFPPQEAMLYAVQAGVDILFFPFYSMTNAPTPAFLHERLLQLVQQGRVSEQRLRQSWQRIMHTKQEFLAKHEQWSRP